VADNFLVDRLITYAGIAAGLLGAILALIGCAIALIAGADLSPAVVLGIAAGAALGFALGARFLIRRIPWFGVVLYAGRRISQHRAKTRDRRGR
jgi:hypothetical protein